MKPPKFNPQLAQEAWIGDAVLALFARLWIVRHYGGMCAERFQNLTSNAFLSCLGNPSEIEAKIGQTYQAQGWEAAVQFMESTLIPSFQKQEAKRRRLGKY